MKIIIHQEQLVTSYLRRRRLCYQVGLSVCLFVRPSDNWKSYEQILTKFLGGVGQAQGPMSSILVTIRITIRIHESEIRIHWIIDIRTDFNEILRRARVLPRVQLITFWQIQPHLLPKSITCNFSAPTRKPYFPRGLNPFYCGFINLSYNDDWRAYSTVQEACSSSANRAKPLLITIRTVRLGL